MKNTAAFSLALIDRICSETFDLEVFKEAGVFVVRSAIPQDVVLEWQCE